MQLMKVFTNNPIYIQNDALMPKIYMHDIIIKTTYQIPPNLNICLSSSKTKIIQRKLIITIFRLNIPHQRVSVMLISKFQLREGNSNHEKRNILTFFY